MKGTYSPDVVMIGFGRPNGYDNVIKECEKKGLAIREFRIFSIQMPMNEEYDDKMNFLKQFVSKPRFDIPDNVFIRPILHKISEQTNLKPFYPKEISDWKIAVKNPCLNSCLHFVGYQNYPDKMNLEIEKKNFDKLTRLESENYQREGLDLVIDEKMPEEFRKQLEERGEIE